MKKNTSRNIVRQLKFLILFGIMIGAFQNCGYIAAPMDPNLLSGAFSSFSTKIPFADLKANVLSPKCIACHSSTTKMGNLDLSSYATTMASVSPGNPMSSKLYQRVADGTMPQGGYLTTAEKQMVSDWIASGANDTVSEDETPPSSNKPPVIQTGGNQTIRVPTTSIVLYATVTDSDGMIATYQWTKLSGGSATLNGATTSVLAVSGLSVGTYIFRLTAVDDKGGSTSAQVTVTVLSENAATPTPTPTPSPTPTPTPTPALTASYSSLNSKVFTPKACAGCHASSMSTYSNLIGSGWITSRNAAASRLYIRTADGTMPQSGVKFTATELEALRTWINNGAPNN